MTTHMYEDIMTWLNDVIRYYKSVVDMPIEITTDKPCRTNEISIYKSVQLDEIILDPVYYFEGLNIKWGITEETFNQNLQKHEKNNPFLYEIIESFQFSMDKPIHFPEIMRKLLEEQISDRKI